MITRFKGRTALVTGATGMVGSWLCDHLLKEGARVVALVLDDDPWSLFYSSGTYKRCSIVRGDLANVSDCRRAVNVDGVDVVFHLGAQTIVSAALRDPLECFESNIRGTYNLLDAVRCLRRSTLPVVVASSDKAYGDSDTLPYTEETPLQGRHPYDVSKSCADLLAQAYSGTYSLNITIARCGNIYGAGDLNWSRIVPGTIRSMFVGEAPSLRSDGTMTRDYIYVRDVVEAYMLLALKSEQIEIRGEAFNFAPGRPMTVLEMVDAIAAAMGVDVTPEIQDVAAMEIKHQMLDASKARRVLGWNMRFGVEAGLRETIEWYRAQIAAEPLGPKHAR